MKEEGEGAVAGAEGAVVEGEGAEAGTALALLAEGTAVETVSASRSGIPECV